MCNIVLGVMQVGALVTLAVSSVLAIWRAVSDYARGDKQASVRAKH